MENHHQAHSLTGVNGSVLGLPTHLPLSSSYPRISIHGGVVRARHVPRFRSAVAPAFAATVSAPPHREPMTDAPLNARVMGDNRAGQRLHLAALLRDVGFRALTRRDLARIHLRILGIVAKETLVSAIVAFGLWLVLARLDLRPSFKNVAVVSLICVGRNVRYYYFR